MIKAVAIKIADKIYFLPSPNRHHNLIHKLAEQGLPTPISGIQGFLTDENRFVDRIEGLKVAQACGQIKQKHGCSSTLFSEDLW